MSHFSLSVPATILPEITWNMNHGDISLFCRHTHGCHEGPHLFSWENTWRRASEPLEKVKQEKKKRQILLTPTPFWNIKPIRTKGLLSYIKVMEELSVCWVSVREKSHCSQSKTKTGNISNILSPSYVTEITSFLLPPLHQQSNHSRLSGNGRYSSHVDLERGRTHNSPIALMDDSWVR